MGNVVKGSVTREALGKTWTLKLGTNALCEIEDKLGQGVDQIGALMADGKAGKIKMIRLILWAAMTQHHPDATLETVGDLLDEFGLDGATELVTELMTRAFPAAKGKATSDQNPLTATGG